MANNDNREENKVCLEGLLEIFFVGIMEIFIELFTALAKKIFEGIFAIAAVVFVIYLLITFLMNHV